MVRTDISYFQQIEAIFKMKIFWQVLKVFIVTVNNLESCLNRLLRNSLHEL